MSVAANGEAPLGELLCQARSLSRNRLDLALAYQKEKGGLLGQILLEKKWVPEDEVFAALARQLGLAHLARIEVGALSPELLARLPVSFLQQHKIVPAMEKGDALLVATANPRDIKPIDALGAALRLRVIPALASERTILSAIHALYERDEHSAGAMMDELRAESASVMSSLETGDELDLSHEAPVIKLVNRIIYQAVRDLASDIHWEPFEKDLRVRLRVDGILHDVLHLDRESHAAITSRLKIMAGMDIAERRVPQDGRIQCKVGERELDMRVSSIPTLHGERIVLRLLDRSNVLLDLEDIGFSHTQFEVFDRLIRCPNGVLLVTGPTGSGKTTTLYAAIQKLSSSEVNVMTIEDPIEYQFEGIAQMPVSHKTGVGFAEGLRSMLRQDPDVILLGEIRDQETAEVAVHASLTGHMVLSTLHTNDAVGAITRLVDMGVEPFLITSSLTGVLAQRLVRKICPACAQPAAPEPRALLEVGIEEAQIPAVAGNLRRGAGCAKCYQTGYRGRIGIFELLVIDDEMRALIMEKREGFMLRSAAVRKGMSTLLQEGGRKVAMGITTPEEVLRVVRP